ncbi:hypothetical protein ZHAS_00014308 [Anopheles sinensis]|uniref:EF-hand domain-containing protein n=1 Tax=Anopheles sinensis TaxID=74873 RepID=A0A084W7X3_ANOSI|nr:hypothetical protein ZHAS_00014308 [Anopheles sinensis]
MTVSLTMPSTDCLALRRIDEMIFQMGDRSKNRWIISDSSPTSYDENQHEGDKPAAETGDHPTETQPYSDETLISLVDPIMDMMDKDRDGFITYTEYRQTENAQT